MFLLYRKYRLGLVNQVFKTYELLAGNSRKYRRCSRRGFFISRIYREKREILLYYLIDSIVNSIINIENIFASSVFWLSYSLYPV